MEKARLTREQAELLEEAVKCSGGYLSETVERAARKHWPDDLQAMKKIDMDLICRALYVGYEVIEEDQQITVTAEMREGLLKALRYPMGKELKQWDEGFAAGMKSTLQQLGIAIKGINE